MGLDVVEIALEVQERFKIRIDDAKAARCTRVGDLCALVSEMLSRFPKPCPTSRAFYDVRSLLIAESGVARACVRPSAIVAELPRQSVINIFESLRSRGYYVPELVHATGVRVALWSMSGLLIASGIHAVNMSFRTLGENGVCGCFVIPIAVTMLICWIWRATRNQLPESIQTVGDLCRAITPTDTSAQAPGDRFIADHHVFQEVRKILSKQLGIPIDKIRPESDIVQDLGCS
jgi:acyl carrier protein